ncbi:MAG TPA: hypothetical protein PLX89_24510 [Verrucomicrobiota bacterium]|nr:hypothetical protein [Verrucomicrobiota bacterium]
MNRAAWIASLLTFAVIAIGADAPATFPVGGLTFKRPEKWTWVEVSSPMRKAQLTVPAGAAKAPGEVVFFHFGPANGGGTQANVDRWLGQFQEKGDALKSKVEDVTVRGKKITFVRAQGTYLSGAPGGPKTPQPDSMLLGAIIEGPEGAVFVRFAGPAALGETVEPEFRKLAESGVP